MGDASPIDLLDDGLDRPRYRLLIIGCGNVLRGDDAAGPVLIRRLWEKQAVSDDVMLSDGGTSGMDVVFKMRDADRVIIIDAAATGAQPGTLYKVPGTALEEVPPITGMGSHDFRWDHAIAVGRWLLGTRMPTQIDVYLIEGQNYGFGEELSSSVSDAIDKVADLIIAESAA